MRKKDIGLKQKISVTCIGMKKKTRLCLLYKKKEAAQHNYSILGKLGGITVLAQWKHVWFWKKNRSQGHSRFGGEKHMGVGIQQQY